MKISGKWYIFFALVFILCSLTLNAQILITGVVTDGTTQETLPGVSILLEGSQRGTITDINGVFSITIPGSESALVFSFLGYQSQRIMVGEQRVLNVVMGADVTQLREVIITGQARGQRMAMQEQIQSNTLKNVVAPDRLQENPDANAVEAIGRLPGISVIRSGGEGSGLVIRGLEPRYTSVTLNGVQMPSSEAASRGTSISSISQYILQGVEVYKALTPDMEANSVAGSINMRLRQTPSGFRSNFMLQGGYNDLNSYYGNYKLQGDISNRFLDNRLGVFVSLNAERVNRSTQTMSAGYGLASAEVDILLNSISLNYIQSIRHRQSAMTAFDYRLSSSTTLSLYGLYTYAKHNNTRQSKIYRTEGAGEVDYNFNYRPDLNSNMLQTTLSGETKYNFIDFEYGLSYSFSGTSDPKSRSWNYQYSIVPSSSNFTTNIRRQDPTEVIRLFHDEGVPLETLRMMNNSVYEREMTDNNISAYLNATVPYKIGNLVTGHVKLGGIVRQKTRFQDIASGINNMGSNQFAKAILADSIDWIVRLGASEDLTAVGLLDDRVIDNFLGGQYNFGHLYRFDRLNEISDMWEKTSAYYFALGSDVWMPIFGGPEKIGYRQDLAASFMDDQDIIENYRAGYTLAEINLGQYAMLLPGIRYEHTNASMRGFTAVQPTLTGPLYRPLPGDSTEATRRDEFWLPMVHLRINPLPWFYTHMAYTQSISRPDFNAIMPNTHLNSGFSPFAYTATNPELKAEQWENYDIQLAFHGSKIGLFAISGFYKTVQDKIWFRQFTRLRGDPVVEPFPDASVVNMSIWENHQYDIYLQGVEIELQTSFWYMPKPLNYFTIYANYTFTESETQYPYSFIRNVVPSTGGRPVATRFDTLITGPMLYQPKHIANFSLGFNREGLNVWLSYQYNGVIFTNKNLRLDDLDPMKEQFYRWDLQVTQSLFGRLNGLEIMANLANLSNFNEVQRLRGDPRFTYTESYGWTLDLGLRYKIP